MATTKWMDRAECRLRPDLDWFDVYCNLQALLEVCVSCKVADECLDYAIEIQADDGVWGGEWGYRLQNYVNAGRGGSHAG
jgi:hypothetical protein